MINSLGYAAWDATRPLGPFSFKRRALRDNDVLVRIDFCGVCHSDIHQARNEWKNTHYPCVVGHEIIGHIEAIGTSVKKFKKGERVGVGVLVDSCQSCMNCKKSIEQYCTRGSIKTYNYPDYETGEITKGGYANNIVVREDFVFHIPKELDSARTAPLLCAGITTYSPLKHWKVKKGQSVGIVGLGGLGHMGIKFAKAMGAEVTLFTSSPGKREDGKRLGAHHVVLSKDMDQMNQARNKLDFILNTVAAPIQLEPYLECLKTDGIMTLVGLPDQLHPPYSVRALIVQRRSISGSAIGGRKETEEMLTFCAKHGIQSDIEIINIENINEAFKKTINGQVKYRFVIDMKSINTKN